MSIDLHSLEIHRQNIQFKLDETIIPANGLVLKINKKINDHTRVYFETPIGEPPEKQQAAYLDQILALKKLAINLINLPGTKDQNGREQPFNLFTGAISHLSVDVINNQYYLKGEALSNSSQLDLEKRKRSFQNEKMTYAELLKQVTAAYGEKIYWSHVDEEQTIMALAVQYRETDWEFLVRMASRLQLGLIPNDAESTIYFKLGLPANKNVYDLNPASYQNYEVLRAGLDYQRQTVNLALEAVPEAKRLRYQINNSQQYLELGDDVNFQPTGAPENKTLTVSQIQIELGDDRKDQSKVKEKNAEAKFKELQNFQYTYTLVPEEAFRQPKFYNSQLRGASITGKVIAAQNDRVKVHLNSIDLEQPLDQAAWFPYGTAYSAESHTGWYWMPENGDYVNLYFPTHEENQAIALGSLRQFNNNKVLTAEPKVKYWRTAQGKEIKFSKDEILIAGYGKDDREQIVSIQMNESTGIKIASTDSNVTLYAKEALTVTSGHNLKIAAGNTLKIFSQTNSLEMDGLTNLKGPAKIN